MLLLLSCPIFFLFRHLTVLHNLSGSDVIIMDWYTEMQQQQSKKGIKYKQAISVDYYSFSIVGFAYF